MYALNFYYDDDLIGDLYPLSQGLSFELERNAVGFIRFSVSLRALAKWCSEKSFDIRRMLTPLRSSVVLTKDGNAVVGGFLSATPDFSLTEAPDALIPMEFAGWLGLTAGAYLMPQGSWRGRFDAIARQKLTEVLDRTESAGRRWRLSVSNTDDELATVEGTIDAPKNLKDFLIERTDNETGTGNFDVYFDPYGEMQIKQKYGHDIRESALFSYPDAGSRYGIKSIEFPAWDNYISHYFLTGEGTGYDDDEPAITAEAVNRQTVENTGYFQNAGVRSDISQQETLDSASSSYVKDTDKPFSNPSITIDASPFRFYSHEQGGNLWLGDIVRVQVEQWVADLLPLDNVSDYRIFRIECSIDSQNQSIARLQMEQA